MAFWGIEIKPGKPHVHQYDDEKGRLHLSQATLGSGSSKEKALLVCNVGDKKPIYLCSLLPRKMETCSLNIEFEEYDEVTFSVEGPHSIHLSGFFFGEKPDSDGDDYDSDYYEDGSLEVGNDSEDYNESDFDSEDDEDDLIDYDMDMFPSSPKAKSGVRIEEIVDDDKTANENANLERSKKKNKRATGNDDTAQGQIVLKDSSSVPVLESEDEDGFPVSSPAKSGARLPSSKEDSDEVNEKGKDGQFKRKKGTDDSVQTAKRKKDKPVEVDDPASEPANASALTPEVDVKKSKKKKNKNKKAKEAQEDCNNCDNGVKSGEETTQEKTPKKVADDSTSVATKTNSKKSNDKKKNKQQGQNVAVKNGSATEEKPSQVRTFPNGLVIEELQMGKPDGKRADPGKKVSVRYIGKLKKDGKIFDSNISKAPFKFRLGVGQVIAGWDVGVKGMRVGDRRRLTIPPAMGYGAKGAGGAIPPNAWLVFEVELIDVN